MRLFFGAWAPPDLIREVQKLSAWLKNIPGKAVELKNLHFTLAFLGEVAPELVTKLAKVGEGVAVANKPLKISLTGWDLIPSVAEARVLAIKTKADDNFLKIQSDLTAAGRGLGLNGVSAKPPHLTLARLKSPMPSPNFDFPNLQLTITEFSLIESTLTTAGPNYKALKHFLLTTGRKKEKYRPNVSICLINKNNEVFLIERAGSPGHWQLPQGGIDEGEKVEPAARRELNEESGIKSVKLLQIGGFKFKYKFPYAHPGYNNDYIGQEQTPVYFQFLGSDGEIKLNLREASGYQWVALNDLVNTVFPVRQEYTKLVYDELKKILKLHD